MSGLSAQMVVRRGSSFRLDLNLQIAPGQTAALLGPNGAGKSTVVAAIAGLVELDAGRIVLGDRVLDDMDAGVRLPPEERRIGVVFQDYLLFPNLSVVENVAFGLRTVGMAREEARSRAVEMLASFDISELAPRRPKDLSGGQAQRVALARSLVTSPELLLLDEPLAALDVSTRARLRHVLADRLDGYPGPRLLITHEPTEAFLLADLIYVIEAGSITQVGSPDEIRLKPRTEYVADLAGANLLVGIARSGALAIGSHELAIADSSISGETIATIHPRAISLHRQRPEGSPRNSWSTRIERIENYGDRVRVQVGEPLPLTAEVTPQAVTALQIGVGEAIWVSIKATEVMVSS